MRIGIPKETDSNEKRVASTPQVIKKLIKLGFSIVVESESGKLSNFSDLDFSKSGAKIVNTEEIWKSDIILKVNPPSDREIDYLKNNSLLISFIWPKKNYDLLKKLSSKNITVIAMDSVPRISRAQSIDALSSMSKISGYRAVIEAAYHFKNFLSGQTTSAGNISPAKVMVIGVGVAGLSAIGTANSLGAIVQAFDTRLEVEEQVKSMGAKFIHLDYPNQEVKNYQINKNKYNNFIKKEKDIISFHAKNSDIIITTVLDIEKNSPILIKKDIVNKMKKGSVIIDFAAQTGGNCELTVKDKIIKSNNGVKIIGYTNFPSLVPFQSSQLYANNLFNLIKMLCKENNGKIEINFKDEVIRNLVVVYKKKIILTPISNKNSLKKKEINIIPIIKEKKKNNYLYKIISLSFFSFLFFFLSFFVTNDFLSNVMIFLLSCIIGYYVVWNVSYSLHTPLMSVTNAISGIIIIGSLLQINNGMYSSILSFIGILIASINIFGGFSITQRMLKMFKKN